MTLRYLQTLTEIAAEQNSTISPPPSRSIFLWCAEKRRGGGPPPWSGAASWGPTLSQNAEPTAAERCENSNTYDDCAVKVASNSLSLCEHETCDWLIAWLEDVGSALPE